jgi:hypothetical protein
MTMATKPQRKEERESLDSARQQIRDLEKKVADLERDRDYNSDIVITGDPVLERLWLELNDAREPRP